MIRLQKEIEKLKSKFIDMATKVEEQVRKTVQVVNERDESGALKIIEEDDQIDKMEVDLEEECLKILALYQPVAADLRFIITVLKINSDLERIADLASNMCERMIFLSKQEKIEMPFNFSKMSIIMIQMLRKSIDSLVAFDKNIANDVLIMDKEIDEIHREMYQRVSREIKQNPNLIDIMINMVAISRTIERLCDHITNIAEDIIYMIDGEIVRHSYKK